MKSIKSQFRFLIAMLLFGGVVFSSVLTTVSAQTVSPPTTPLATPTVSSPITQDQFDDLKSRVNKLEDDVRPFSNWIILLGLAGFASPFLLAKFAYDYHKKALRDAFYRADPRNIPVYIPKRNFDIEKKSLEKLGLKKLRTYEFLDEIGDRGVIVFHIAGENFERDDKAKKRLVELLGELKSFIEDNTEKPLAYVVYIKGQPPELRDLLQTGNVASANMPVTIAGHVYTLAHGLMD